MKTRPSFVIKGNTLPTRGFCVILALLLALPLSALAQQDAGPPNGEVQVSYADGKPKAIATYQQGLLNGYYRAYAENGQMIVQARFKRGVLNSRLQRWTADGERLEIAYYRAGVLSGDRTVFVNGRPALKQEYEAGELKNSEGDTAIIPEPVVYLLGNDPEAMIEESFGKVEPAPEQLTLADRKPMGYPLSLAELKQQVDKIADAEVKGALTEEQTDAVRRSMLHRLVSGVPKYAINHDPKDAEAAVIGSEVMHKLQDMTHFPTNPGMPEDRFKLGYFATSNGNIAYTSKDQQSPAYLVDIWVVDRGDNNRDEVGHRRWILEPGLFEIGYGSFKNYYTMVVVPNYKRGARYELITYPGQGYVPSDTVPGNCIWSVHPSPDRYALPPSADQVKVHVFRLTTDGKREPIEIQRTHITQDPNMPLRGVLFEPKIDQSEHNARYEVHIDGLIPSSKRFRDRLSYTVHFIDLKQVAEAQEEDQTRKPIE